SKSANLKAILASPNYKLAEKDTDLLAKPELRPVRLQLEFLKPELALREHNVRSTIVVFGGTQIVERREAQRRLRGAKALLTKKPHDAAVQRLVARAERIVDKAHYYDEAREFGRIVSAAGQAEPPR